MRKFIPWTFAFLIFGSDQLLKAHVMATMQIFDRLSILGQDWFTLGRIHNLGLIGDRFSNIPKGFNEPYLLYFPAACLVALSLVALTRLGRARQMERISIASMLAGGVSNLSDHWQTGRVVDTLQLYIGSGKYLPFNTADLGLMLGAIGMALSLVPELWTRTIKI